MTAAVHPKPLGYCSLTEMSERWISAVVHQARRFYESHECRTLFSRGKFFFRKADADLIGNVSAYLRNFE